MDDVVFYEVFDEERKSLEREVPTELHVRYVPETIQESGEEKPTAPLVSIRTQSRVPQSWLKLVKGILTRSRGYDHIRNFAGSVPCGYLEEYCARAVAEQAVLMMLALLRKINQQQEQFKSFRRDGLTGRECRGRNALIAGVGHIGGEIVDIVRGLRMNVKGFDKIHGHADLEYISLTDGLKWAEVVFCSLSLDESTRGMLNADMLREAKPGLVLINVARGEITPAGDLIQLLDNGALAGVGLDVFPGEDLLARHLRGSPAGESRDVSAVLGLAQRDTVICTPHNAFNTVEALERKSAMSARAVVQFLKNGTFPCPVSAE